MKIYIQSKSGDYNTAYEAEGIGTLAGAMSHLRYKGSFTAEYHRTGKEIQVPFEEIEFIRKATDND